MKFKGNEALDGDGGFLSCQTCLVAIQKSSFKKNIATYGGCISVSENSMLDVIESEFYKNAATASGGCIIANETEIFVQGTQMNENLALIAAGIATDSGSIVIENSVFEDNIGDFLTSVLFVQDAMSDIKESTFTNNFCPGGTSIGFNKVYQGRLINNTFVLNTGLTSAIASSLSRTEIKACHFESNVANISALCTIDFSSTSFITESYFVSNEGVKGSCFELKGSSSLIIENSGFTNNKGTYGSITYIGGTNNAFVLRDCATDNNKGEDTSKFVYEENPGKNIIIIDDI